MPDWVRSNKWIQKDWDKRVYQYSHKKVYWFDYSYESFLNRPGWSSVTYK